MALFALVSCREEEELESSNSDLYIEQKEFNVNPSGETIYVKVKSARIKPECVISENAKDWILLSSWGGVDAGDTGEYTFIYKVLANDGYEENRVGSIRVTSGSFSDVVNIHQTGGAPFAFIKERKLGINADGGVLTINPKMNFNPEYIKDVSATWLLFEKTAVDAQDGKTKEMQFTVLANETGSDRSVDIFYEDKETGQQDKFTILQGCRIVSSQKEFVINEDMQNVTLTLNSSLDIEPSTLASWLIVDNKGKVTIQALPDGLNEREAIVKYINKSNQISEDVKVTQVRSIRIVGNDFEVKTLDLIPDFPFQLLAGTSVLTKDEEIVWSSSKESVATVSANGLITPIRVGETKITLKAGIYQKSCDIKVREFKEMLPIKYEGNYTLSVGDKNVKSNNYEGNFELTNNSSYIVTVKSVGGSSYNKITKTGDVFECPFKLSYDGDATTEYPVNWKVNIGKTPATIQVVFRGGSIVY